ncbi:hypothetical protein Vretifemale_14057 [Volvox reticuliferus]|uniref:Uncharacterized protein n=1 Tax=Volvox reticuliferus TaxID=1737510 RepID=A0A8J4FTQ3_9CHLO|nr:hypothetical protein Vretifemale_14057 [Volvox reticuliferus]
MGICFDAPRSATPSVYSSPAQPTPVRNIVLHRYLKAARGIPAKRRGYDLEGILSGLDVKVRPVPQGPQKADVLLQGEATDLLKAMMRRGTITTSKRCSRCFL